MKKLIIILMVCGFTHIACKSSEPVLTEAEMNAFNLLIEKRAYRIESDMAYPQVTAALQSVMNSSLAPLGSSASAISLIGNPNFLEIKEDSISSFLPYFGERQMQVGYGTDDSAIQFDGLVENYKAELSKKNTYDVSFEAKSKSEKFNVNIIIFSNSKADISISGGSRLAIRYSGKIVSP